MRLKILLTEKVGQLGLDVHCFLPTLGDLVAPDRRELDLLDPDSIRRMVRNIRPQLIVNAAAYTAVDAAESDEANAHAVNAIAPAVLAEEAKELGAAVVHYSTDYVFDGAKTAPYEEMDPANPISVYGKTKLAGELAIRSSGVPHLIFRTAWVYATRGRNFLLTILRLATEKEELRIVRDQTGAPTCASEVAAATSKILAGICERNNGGPLFPEVSGTYHMSAAGQTTWHDFAKTILEAAEASSHNMVWLAAATGGRPFFSPRVIPLSPEKFLSPPPPPPIQFFLTLPSFRPLLFPFPTCLPP